MISQDPNWVGRIKELIRLIHEKMMVFYYDPIPIPYYSLAEFDIRTVSYHDD